MVYYISSRNPKVWGPTLWNEFFTRAGTYPKSNPSKETAKVYKNYYKSFVGNLPCSLCNPSFKQFWEEIPIDNYLSSRRDLIMWLYLIKNRVNRKLNGEGGKLRISPPFKDVLIKYF